MLVLAIMWNSLSYLSLTGCCVLFPGLFAVGWYGPVGIKILHSP